MHIHIKILTCQKDIVSAKQKLFRLINDERLSRNKFRNDIHHAKLFVIPHL